MKLIEKLDKTFQEAPPILKIALCPVLGGIFIMFLPLAGFYLSVQAVIEWVSRKLHRDADVTVPGADSSSCP